MEVLINGKTLDITLENEKNIGQVIAGLEQWLSGCGHILTKLSIDGSDVPASQVEEAFNKDIDSVTSLDIQTDVKSNLTSSALFTLLEDIKEYENLDYEKKNSFFENWKNKPHVTYTSGQIPDLYSSCVKAFSRGEIAPENLYSITKERLNEVNNPLDEFKKIEPLLNEVCGSLVDLPLDIQTGKDFKAAQTIQFFAAVTEKILRIYDELNYQGCIAINNEQLTTSITQFNNLLRELMEAYERNDLVLVGDIAEYEASVKIKELYNIILEHSRGEK